MLKLLEMLAKVLSCNVRRIELTFQMVGRVEGYPELGQRVEQSQDAICVCERRRA